MGRKKSEKVLAADGEKRGDISVKFDRVLGNKLKLIVERRGGTMASFLTDYCRAHIEREYAKVVREMAEEVKGHE